MPEMCIWSLLLIKSDLELLKDISRILFLYFNSLVSVTAGHRWTRKVSEGTCSQVLRSTSVDS